MLLAACESATGSRPGNSPPVEGDLSDPLVSGDPAILEGSWVAIRTESASGGGTVTTTRTLTFNDGAYSAQQVNSYSDKRADDVFSQEGTATFQTSDGTVTIHETRETRNDIGPDSIDRSSTWRNLVIDDVWHPREVQWTSRTRCQAHRGAPVTGPGRPDYGDCGIAASVVA